MDFFFPTLMNTCGLGSRTGAYYYCIDDHDHDPANANERKQSRNGYFWTQDGMLQQHDDDDGTTTASYFSSSRYGLSSSRTVVEGSCDEMTVGFFTESDDSRTSGELEWTGENNNNNKTAAGTKKKTKKSSFFSSWRLQESSNTNTTNTNTNTNSNHRKSSGQQQYYNDYYARHNNDVDVTTTTSPSPTNSVGAVREGGDNKSAKKVAVSYYSSSSSKNAFDYIIRNKTRKQFAMPCQDPPSDKSMATSRSIRAADAGSVFFKKTARCFQKQLRRKNDELAKQILKRRQMGVIQAGHEP